MSKFTRAYSQNEVTVIDVKTDAVSIDEVFDAFTCITGMISISGGAWTISQAGHGDCTTWETLGSGTGAGTTLLDYIHGGVVKVEVTNAQTKVRVTVTDAAQAPHTVTVNSTDYTGEDLDELAADYGAGAVVSDDVLTITTGDATTVSSGLLVEAAGASIVTIEGALK